MEPHRHRKVGRVAGRATGRSSRSLWSPPALVAPPGLSPGVCEPNCARPRPIFGVFWAAFEPILRTAPILRTNDDQWVAPSRASIVKDSEEVEAARILAAIGGVFAHP